MIVSGVQTVREPSLGVVLARHVLAVLAAPWERSSITVCLRSGRVSVVSLQEYRRRSARGWRCEVLADLAALQQIQRDRPGGELEDWAASVAEELTCWAEAAAVRGSRRRAS